MKTNNTARKSSAPTKSAGKKSTGSSSSKSSSTKSVSTASRNGTHGSKASSKKTGNPQESLKKILEDLLKDTYWAEKHLTKALPKMSKAADSSELKEAFDNHLTETEEQVSRLENVFEILGLKVAAKKCAAMEGLVEEGKEIIEEHEAGPVRDAALIIAAQKIEHYEIAAYGSMRTLTKVMGEDDATQLLEETLDEESSTDELLTQIAMRINQEAYGTSNEEEEDEEDSDDDEEESDDVEASNEEKKEVAETGKRRR